MAWKRSGSVRGRTLFVTTIALLIASEFAGICISAFVYGFYTPRQAIGLFVVEGVAIFVYTGERRALRIFGSALLVMAAWGIWDLASHRYEASGHVALVASQTSLRFIGSLVLLGSRAVAVYAERLRQSGDRRKGAN